MLAAGVDVGALYSKVVLVRDGAPLGDQVFQADYERPDQAVETLRGLLEVQGAALGDLSAVGACGQGRRGVAMATRIVSEVSAVARGVKALFPEARGFVDAGAHSMRAAALDARGAVARFLINDKCAAETGCFLDVIAQALGIRVADAGPMAMCARQPEKIGLTCTVFAESEVVSLVAQGKRPEDILAGLARAVAHRIAGMVKQTGAQAPIAFVGGVARNEAVARALEAALGKPVLIPDDPQCVGALGAALLALEQGPGRAESA